ncbi:uncharacterized protein LOC131693044 isoform X3 [Topomyia yanbarensis]|uniref:uncharacterized protein LOC131693044 isoform X3 n=1 Tax=Topomyia yanbarensis TaxID=2498891 RepID=UPI00273A7719|nr:uncharacterized protein LOC131693044 isoform X3 [Topomyia yanbarensis]
MDECQNEIDFEELEKLCSSVSDDADTCSMGQSESKKSSKKAVAGLETKGTAMSFGFKKYKVHQTSGANSKLPGPTNGIDGTTNGPGPGTGTFKKVGVINGNNLYGGGSEKERAAERDNATVISNPGVDGIFSDKNGNMGSTELINDDNGKTNGRSTPRLQPPKKDTYGAPYRNNRFGFRTSNVVRPASVGLQPKTIADYDKQHSTNNNNNNNNNQTNNNNNVYITDKRRSKSASSAATARTTFTPLQQAPSQIQQERSSALPHPGIGALHKPLPKYQSASSATKITLLDSSSTTVASGTQQMMTKRDQVEHKNTSENAPAAAALNGSTDEHRPQSNVNNINGRQHVSIADSAQHHAAANSITKLAPKTAHANGSETASVAKFTLHSSSLPKPQYPVPISLSAANPRYDMDPKGAKQAVNISRKGTLQGQQMYQLERSIDQLPDHSYEHNPNVDTASNIRMPRQRYRNLEMVMSGRHKFEVRDLETLTAEPIVSLALPKLPDSFNSSGQQQPIGMSGLVRSSELPRQLSDDIDINDNRYESEQSPVQRKDSIASSDLESLEEEKLTRDNNSSEKSLKGAIIKDLIESHCSKTSSPGSSRASWCNAGETMAAKDCSSFSLSSEESNANPQMRDKKRPIEEEDVSTVTITAGNPSCMSSISAAVPMDISTNLDSVSEVQNSFNDNTLSDQSENNQIFRTEETKFAEIAAAVDDNLLLDDETSPTDSLVSSCTDSDDVRKHRKKVAEVKIDKDKERDIDEISPELDELTSPVTPGTPTHASNSLSLSDGGRDFLIDDEIADQPELVFDEPALNDSSMVDLGSIHINITDEAATLKDSLSSLNNNKNASKSAAPVPKPRKIMSDIYESPASIRKNRTRLSRAESLDTLSPCDSIASDDYMLDFNSSMDSIDRPPRSNASGSVSALHSMDELQLWSELETKGGTLMHEWSKLLRSQRNSNNNTSRESITSQLPTRATRLLTRRLQNNATPTNCGIGGGSDSPRSMDSLPRRTTLSAAYKTATLNQFNGMNNNNNLDSASTATNSAEDLTLLDKSLRNSMLHDVVHFKKQLVRLRRILQEDEENLMTTDTLNPFENNNGQFFTTTPSATTTGVASLLLEDGTPAAGTSIASVDSKQQENLLIKESGVVALALLEDQRQELADLRRQVVYLQGEMTAKDRTIRQQQNLIEKYEAEREKLQAALPNTPDGATGETLADKTIDTISTATQTERLRPLSFGGPEGLASRSEPSTPSNAPPLRNGLRSPATANSSHHSHHHQTHNPNSGTPPSALINSSRTSLNLKPKTQISSVYTQLSSIKHSTHNGIASNAALTTLSHKRASLGSSGNLSNIPTTNSSSPTKTVRTTHIGNVLTSSKLNQAGSSLPCTPPSPTANGSRLLKSSVRTQINGGSIASPTKLGTTSPKRTSAIKPPSSFGSNTFPEAPPTSHKSKSAPVTPMIERISSPQAGGVQIVIENVDNVSRSVRVKENGCHGQQNGCPSILTDDGENNKRNGQHEDHENDDDDDNKEQIAETEKDAINNKINSLKLANGLTGCNDSSSKERSLVI